MNEIVLLLILFFLGLCTLFSSIYIALKNIIIYYELLVNDNKNVEQWFWMNSLISWFNLSLFGLRMNKWILPKVEGGNDDQLEFFHIMMNNKLYKIGFYLSIFLILFVFINNPLVAFGIFFFILIFLMLLVNCLIYVIVLIPSIWKILKNFYMIIKGMKNIGFMHIIYFILSHLSLCIPFFGFRIYKSIINKLEFKEEFKTYYDVNIVNNKVVNFTFYSYSFMFIYMILFFISIWIIKILSDKYKVI